MVRMEIDVARHWNECRATSFHPEYFISKNLFDFDNYPEFKKLFEHLIRNT